MFICKTVRGPCVKCVSPAVSAGVEISSDDGAIEVSAPVGIKGANLSDDVVTIQTALNQVQADHGGASPPLAVDGLCGPKTDKAIQVFQLKHFGWKGADGLIEPGRQTIAKLNELLGSRMAAKIGEAGDGGAPAVVFPLTIRLSMDRALQYVSAAQANLLSAALDLDDTAPSVGRFSVFSREFKMRLLNKHFKLDDLPASRRRRGFHLLQKIFNRMFQVFQRPGGLWGYAIFEPDPLNQEISAFTSFGGFFSGGQLRVERGVKLRLDAVYICRRFVPRPLDFQALVIVHELAHFVGFPEQIDDFAYNEDQNGVKLGQLSPELRILNADSYANFAFEARTGNEPLSFPP